MKKTILLIAILFVIISANSASITLHDGESYHLEMLEMKDDGILETDAGKFNRENVKKIIVSAERNEFDYEYPAFPLKDDKLAEYRQIAEELEDKYPQANGITLDYYEKKNLTSDGRWFEYVHYARKVLTPEKLNWASQSFYLAEGENQIKILVARSISPDGEVHNLDLNDIVIAAPTRGIKFFGKGLRMSFAVPKVEVGSIIEIAYTNEYYSPEDPNLFSFRYPFQSKEPSKHDRLDVEVPKDRTIYYLSQYLDDYFKKNYVSNIPDIELPESEVENPTYAKIEETDSSKIYTWQMTDIEPMLPEPDMFDNRNVAPYVEGGLYPDHSYYNERYTRLYLEHMKPTPTLDSVAHAVTEGAETDREKVARLYHWVQRNIRYVSIKGTLASSKAGHYAQITYDNKYGDCTDKAVLFATLLRIVGIEAYTISLLTNHEGFVDRSRFPSLSTNHCINEVWWDGEPHVLDATGNNMRFPYCAHRDSDIWYCNYIRGEAVYNPPVAPEDNFKNRDIVVDIVHNGDKFDAEVYDSSSFAGSYESWYRGHFERLSDENEMQYVQKRASGRYSGSSVIDYRAYNESDISRPFSFAMDYQAKDILTKAGDLYFLDTKVSHSFDEATLKERKYGIKLYMGKRNANRIEFNIPDNLEIAYLPEPVDIENEYFDYEASFVQNGHRIIFEDRYDVKKIRIPPEYYQYYKSEAEKVLEFDRQKIVLKSK
ncbi:MAG: DUF3857 domain-containing transglutaminase family protein [Candidatus Zixiibacteriota bacterium]